MMEKSRFIFIILISLNKNYGLMVSKNNAIKPIDE